MNDRKDPFGFGLDEVAVFDVGRYVECDMDGTDLTDDPRSGGFLFSGKGVGPCCAERVMKSVRGYGEEEFIRGYCPEGVSFADWIRGIRGQMPGGNTVRIYGSDKRTAMEAGAESDGAL